MLYRKDSKISWIFIKLNVKAVGVEIVAIRAIIHNVVCVNMEYVMDILMGHVIAISGHFIQSHFMSLSR